MTEESPSPAEGQFLVYQTENGKLKIDVRFEGELERAATVKESLLVRHQREDDHH